METTNRMFNKSLIVFVITGMFFAACTTQTKDSTMPYKVSPKAQWVKELQQKNPLKDSTGLTSVYFRFDTIVNDFEVSGILYPSYLEKYGWNDSENGARIFFHSLETDKEYTWTDYDEKYHCFRTIFMSKNVADIVTAKGFQGFKNGDSYIFRYDTTIYSNPDNPLLPYAEYQFYDADFDGEDELMLGFYRGGPHLCPCYEIYDLTDSGLVVKSADDGFGSFLLDSYSKFDSVNRTIANTIYCGVSWGEYVYKANDEGQFYLLYHVSCESDSEHDTILCDTTFYR